MAASDIPFMKSDTWVLLSVGLAGRVRPATLTDVVAMGDAINHAILSGPEIRHGLATLTAAGYVAEQDGGFVVGGAAAHLWAAIEWRTRNLYEIWDDIDGFLQVSQAPEPQDSVFDDPDWTYPSVTDEAVDAAYAEYIRLVKAPRERSEANIAAEPQLDASTPNSRPADDGESDE